MPLRRCKEAERFERPQEVPTVSKGWTEGCPSCTAALCPFTLSSAVHAAVSPARAFRSLIVRSTAPSGVTNVMAASCPACCAQDGPGRPPDSLPAMPLATAAAALRRGRRSALCSGVFSEVQLPPESPDVDPAGRAQSGHMLGP